MEKLLEQDTIIEYQIEGLKGRGKIVGYHSILPIIGALYIVESLDDIIKNEGVYNYTHFICPACYIL